MTKKAENERQMEGEVAGGKLSYDVSHIDDRFPRTVILVRKFATKGPPARQGARGVRGSVSVAPVRLPTPERPSG